MLAGVMQEVRNCLSDCRSVLERMLELTEGPDGVAAYKENCQADEEELQRLSMSASDYTEFSAALAELKFTSLSRKKQEDASQEKKELFQALRDHIKKQIKKLQESFFYESPAELLQSITHMELPMRGLILITKEFMARYGEQKKEKNLLDFNDLEHMALRILNVGINGPAVAFWHHIQVAQYRNHLFTVAVFAPAYLVIHVDGGKAQLFRTVQHILQAILYRLAVGITAVILGVDTGDADTTLQVSNQGVFILLKISLEFHALFSCSSHSKTTLLRSYSS